MIKHRKTILFLLLAYALFIVGIYDVRADSYNITYDNGSYFCNSDSCTSVNLGYYTKNGTIYYEYQGVNNGSERYNYLELRTIKSQDISNYDYILLQVSSYSWMTMSSILVMTTQGTLYGYPISTTASDSSNIKTSIYKIDCSSSSTLNGNMRFYFDITETNRFYMYFPIYFYFGKDGDTTSQVIANNTTNINNSINDSSIDNNNTSSSTTSWGNKNATNGTITNLLTLPISLLQAIVNGLQTTCSSFSLGSLFNTNITLPCINISNLIGNGLWTTIDILFSGFMILAIGKKLVKIFNDFTNLKTNQVDELYGGGK